MAFPNYHFQGSDTSTEYAQRTNALLQIKSMINGSLLQFKAFLTTFSQDFNSTWNTENVFGRLDPIPTFSNTTRKISLAWDIPAYNLEDAMNNLSKCSSLIQMMYPNYEYAATNNTAANTNGGATTTSTYPKANSLTQPPLIKIKFANLIANSFGQEGGESVENGGLLGWADGVTWQPNLDAGMFIEMASDGGEATFYPKMISLSMNFNVLHHGDPKAVPVLNGDSRNLNFPFGPSGKVIGTPNPYVPANDKPPAVNTDSTNNTENNGGSS